LQLNDLIKEPLKILLGFLAEVVKTAQGNWLGNLRGRLFEKFGTVFSDNVFERGFGLLSKQFDPGNSKITDNFRNHVMVSLQSSASDNAVVRKDKCSHHQA
jgi:hypothetical protein